MRFGKSAAEAAEEPGRGGSGGDFIRYLKDGDTHVPHPAGARRVDLLLGALHPGGVLLPVPTGRDDPIEDCPGCSVDNEKMKKVLAEDRVQRAALLQRQRVRGRHEDRPDGEREAGEPLQAASARSPTVTTRSPSTRPPGPLRLRRGGQHAHPGGPAQGGVEGHRGACCQQAWDDAWGDPNQAEANRQAIESAPAEPTATVRPTIAPTPTCSRRSPLLRSRRRSTRRQTFAQMEHRETSWSLIKSEHEDGSRRRR